MTWLNTVLVPVHLLGLALGVGAATVKLALVLRSRSKPAFLPVFLEVRRPITRFIIGGLALATLSGIGWLVEGYPWSPRLVAKVAVVAAIWALGPLIDNVVEPRLVRTAPAAGEAAGAAFLAAQRTYLVCEVAATLLMYAAFALGVSL
ncbi:MAG: hypothetical protein F9K18_13925 [Thermoanaerobaculia bacterium]|nr:MAG: hypothetical protein F9K18_13925 [Thermoanaerobaculia bacterium]